MDDPLELPSNFSYTNNTLPGTQLDNTPNNERQPNICNQRYDSMAFMKNRVIGLSFFYFLIKFN